MDGVRYVFALLWLVTLLPLLLFWIALHPFVGFWRRMGIATSYTILLAGAVALGLLLFAARGPLLAVAFATGPVWWGLTAVFYVLSLTVETQARKELGLATLVGVHELRGTDEESALLTRGIYARMRHPRYVGAVLGYVASACLANYLFLWAVLPLFLLLLHAVVLLEERELIDRFGAAYADYMARVPRYLPLIGRPAP